DHASQWAARVDGSLFALKQVAPRVLNARGTHFSLSAIAAITHCCDCRKARKSGKRFCSNQISRCKALLNGRQCLLLCHFAPCNAPLQFSKPSRKLVTPSRRPSSSRLFQRCWPDAMSSGSHKPEREKRLHSFGRSLPS